MSRLCHFLGGLNITIMSLLDWVKCHDYVTFWDGLNVTIMSPLGWVKCHDYVTSCVG